MNKAFFQFAGLLFLFFATWYGLSQVNWPKVFKTEEVSQNSDKELGDFFWEYIQGTETEVYNKQAIKSVDSLFNALCVANDIDPKSIKWHLISKDEVNAFALPGKHMVVYTGLIKEARNEAELCGVIGHELAHIQKDHVMKKLGKEIGLSALIALVAGNGGGESVAQILKMISSTAYDRELEREADKTSVDYLLAANINPAPFADFLFRLSTQADKLTPIDDWVSTHPDSKERAELILSYFNAKKIKSKNILSDSSWAELKTVLGEEE